MLMLKKKYNKYRLSLDFDCNLEEIAKKIFQRRPKLLIIFAHLAAKKQGALLNLTLLFQNRVNLSPSQLLMHTSQDYHG